MQNIITWLRRVVAVHRATPPRELREPLRPTPQTATVYHGNGDALLRTVANAQEGSRNATLHWAACRAVEDGLIDQIEDKLVVAAMLAGLNETEARRMVASARRTS